MIDRPLAHGRWVALAILGLLAGCAALGRMSVVEAVAWKRWEAHEPASKASVDHAAWDGFLARYVATGPDEINRVDYGNVTEADKASLTNYLQMLSHVPVSTLSRPEQFAFWVNLHNALAVKLVLDHYPVSSIREINLSRGVSEWGPMRAKVISIQGEPVSIDDIVHRVLRPIWADARVHYLLSAGATGGPNLPRRAVTAATALEAMQQGGRAFVNHPRGITMIGDRAEIASLYVWYEPDFGGGERGVIAHLRRFAAPALSATLAKSGRYSDRGYDWTLNDAAFAPKPASE